jgi:uncharacterized protein YjbI with pentapeptide repeats
MSEAGFHRANLSEADLSKSVLAKACLTGACLADSKLDGADLKFADLTDSDLSGAQLSGADLTNAILRDANLFDADLSDARLNRADLSWSNLRLARMTGADVSEADLREAKLMGANLKCANLSGANLSHANLGKANLSGVDLTASLLLETSLRMADLTDARVYGVSAWGVSLKGARQRDLVITPRNEPKITVDNLEVAQFIYLLLNNERVRAIIDTVTSKVVLILGRFTAERKAVLDSLRDHLRRCNYTPVLFDFDKPASRDLTETVRTLAHLSRFIIADITDPKSVPQELQAVVPDLAVPVQPIICRPQKPWGMFVDFPRKYHWVLKPYEYEDLADLLAAIGPEVIAPAEAKAKELVAR